MCGRVVVDYDEASRGASASEIAAWLASFPDDAKSSWNIAPTQNIPIAYTSERDHEKRLDLAHWGIIPPWSTDGKARFTFNARTETVMEKRTFAPSVKARRCVVPVTAFYEWTGPKNNRVPHAIFGPGPILPLAGLYGWWQAPDGEWKLTATILTTSATGVMTALHDRMPVFMSAELVEDWLDPTIAGDQSMIDAAVALAEPISEQLREWPVRPLQRGANGPELLTPLP